MILDTLASAGRYVALNPHLATGFAFLARPDLTSLPVGRHEIDGTRVFALVSQPAGRGEAGARLEIHRRYLDIQVTLAGSERIGWLPLSECKQIAVPYDEQRDLGYFADRPTVWTSLPPGHFAIYFPEDAHAPMGGEGPLHKIVIKVEIDSG
jgi:biofilm protein TabA